MISRNIKLLRLDSFFYWLYPMTILMVVYLESITNSYAYAMLMISIRTITISIMEIPTGIFSDKIGRKKTLVLAGIIFFISCFLYAVAGSFVSIPILIIASILLGTSEALSSGTDEALMYETVDEMGKSDKFNVIYAKNGFWIQIGLLSAAIIGAVTTYYYDMVVLAWISVIVTIPCCILRFFYIEPQRTKKQKKVTTYRHLRKSLKELWKNKRLRFYAIVNIFDNSISNSSGRIESAYFATLVPLWLVNVARMVKQISGAIGFAIISKIKHFGPVKILFTSMIGMVIVRSISVIANNISTPFIFSLGNIFYSTTITSTSDILHQEFTDHQRATMKSIISFIGNIITAFALYGLGVIADITSPTMAIIIGLLAKTIVIILSLMFLRLRKGSKNVI